MPEVRVTDEKGNVHVFPDGSTPEMISQVMGLKPSGNQTQPPPEQPSFLKRTAQSAGVPTSMGELQGMSDQMNPSQHPSNLISPAMPILRGYAQNLGGRLKDAFGEAREAGENIGNGQPVLPNLGKAAYGGMKAFNAAIPFVGENANNLGDDVANKNYAGAAGDVVGTGAAVVAPEAIGKGIKFARAEGNPGAVYQRYLDPVSKQPGRLPNVTPMIGKAIQRELGGVTENAPILRRLSEGDETLGDLDVIRQKANRMGKPVYNGTTPYPAPVAEGAAKLGGQIRDQLYPAIEQANKLPEGTLRPFKESQGRLMKSRSRPVLNPSIDPIEQVANPTRWPGIISRSLMRTGREAIEIGRTKFNSMDLPEPYSPPPPRASMPPPPVPNRPRLPSAPIPMPGEVAQPSATPFSSTTRAQRLGLLLEDSSPIQLGGQTSTPRPPSNPTTRAERLGLLLPERTGGIPLPAAEINGPQGVLSAGRVIVRDPRTGRMRVQFTTSTK